MLTRQRRRQNALQRWGRFAGQLTRQSRQVAVKGGALVATAAARFAKERAFKAVKKAISKKKDTPVMKVHPIGGHHWKAKYAEFNKLAKTNAILSKGQSKRYDTYTQTELLNGNSGKQITNGTKMSVLTPYDISALTAYTASSVRQPFIKWVKARLIITNCSNANTFVSLYIVKGKGDHQEMLESPQDDWAAGIVATGGVGVLGYQLPGNEPNTSPTFRQKWKVLKKSKLPMGAGETLTFDYYHACNHKLNQRRIWDAVNGTGAITAPGTGAYGPLTRYFMIAAHGAAYPNQSDEPSNDVSTSAVNLAVVLTYTYCSQNFNVSSEASNYTNNLTTDQRKIQEYDAAVVAPTAPA